MRKITFFSVLLLTLGATPQAYAKLRCHFTWLVRTQNGVSLNLVETSGVRQSAIPQHITQAINEKPLDSEELLMDELHFETDWSEDKNADNWSSATYIMPKTGLVLELKAEQTVSGDIYENYKIIPPRGRTVTGGGLVPSNVCQNFALGLFTHHSQRALVDLARY